MRTLVVSTFGSFLAKHSERIQVRQGGEVKQEIPFFRVKEIVVTTRGVGISSDLIEEACRRGIPVSFLGDGARPFAMITSPHLTATVKTRRAQLEAFGDRRSGDLAKALVAGKLKNQANLLKYFAKYLKEHAPEDYTGTRQAALSIERRRAEVRKFATGRVDDLRARLMAAEGDGAKQYWRGVAAILRRTDFVGREHRGAVDPVNALLNYGYGILYSRVWGALMNAGLDPYAGFLHVDRPGKPSLVLDLIEEFRQPVVDRAVLALLNRGEAVKLDKGKLDLPTRRLLAERVLERLEGEAEYRGRKYAIGSIIQAQAYSLAAALRGERGYRAYRFRW